MEEKMGELNKHRNHGLFSDYFLNELLPQRLSEWQDHALIQKALNEIKSLYDSLKSSLPKQSEPQLEEKFIKKILAILGHVFEVQPTLVSTATGMKKPDYALFPDRRTQESVQHLKGKLEFFKKVLAIAEAKKWERSLDKEIKHIEDKDNPSLQMDRYLYYTEVPWGILTNGRYWRLYNRKTSKELDNYFEVDLQQVLETSDLEAFKYFYFFFRREAFPEFVEQVYRGSVDYAKELGDNLKENVYEALKILARGFLKTPRNNLDTEKDLKEIHDNCLILLYRIIFLLYAESPRRGERLLPLDDAVYRDQYSIHALKNKVRDMLTQRAEISPIKTTLWSELKALFALVNQGSESMGIPKERFFVPAYNGGLFDEREHEFLEKYTIADLYLAQAIDLLARTPVKGNHEKTFADYGSLQIRHLGSIYEGLLEYKLGIAKEKMVAISEKGKQKWVKASEAKGKKAIEEVEAGDVYLYTDKGERKATGSYYTPDYIVDYIVQNTLRPILEDLKKQVNGNSTKLIDAILNLKVLDPAMGSGHFLVAATDYLAHALVEALGGSEKELEEDDIRWARREIVERCIFGVDLNPLAVELAKLSLWLATVSKNKPLSFLDHHLRCGNSLIGATIKNLADLPEIGKKKKRKKGTGQQLTLFEIIFKKQVNELLKDFERIESLPSETVEQIRHKEKLYGDFRRKVDRFKIVADLWTSRYFGNELGWGDYNALQEGLKAEEEWQQLTLNEWFKKGVSIAEEKHFFHWELEFPEVFFAAGREPGFDAVIGNPPYGYRMIPSSEEKRYYENSFEAHEYDYEFYIYFTERALKASQFKGIVSFIVPNTFLTGVNFSKFRQMLLQRCSIRELTYVGLGIFEGVTIENILFFASPGHKASNDIKIRLAPDTAKRQLIDGISYILKQNVIKDAINIEVHGDRESIVKRMNHSSVPLSELAYVTVGINTGYIRDKLIAKSRLNARYHKVLTGRDINRYSYEWQGEWICYDPELVATYGELGRTLPPEYIFIKPKLLLQRTRRGLDVKLIATYDGDQFYNLNRLSNVVMLDNQDLSIFYVLALLNARLLDRYFNWVFREYEVKPAHLRKLPIRRIEFTTPQAERKCLLERGQRLYESYLEKGDLDSVIEFTLERLGHKPEQADVIHDLLAYLAEQMIEMNKEKNQEIKGFLTWLEDYLGVKIDDLKNKTKIREYHEGTLERLLDVLDENRKIITKVNIQGREAHDQIEVEFEASMTKLKLLKGRIEATDRLIDQIVYKLYGLTDEEIRIVEESIKQQPSERGDANAQVD